MKHGFLKVAAATPDIRVADVEFNTAKICEAISETCEQKAKIIVFPELCVTGYTCGDLFTQDVLLKAAKDALVKIAEYTADKDILVFAGAPLSVGGKLYNVAAAMNQGRVIGLTGQGNRTYDKDISPQLCGILRDAPVYARSGRRGIYRFQRTESAIRTAAFV